MPIEHTEGRTNASEYLFKNQNFTLKYFFFENFIYFYRVFCSYLSNTASLLLPWCSLHSLPPKFLTSFLRKKNPKTSVCVCVVNV